MQDYTSPVWSTEGEGRGEAAGGTHRACRCALGHGGRRKGACLAGGPRAQTEGGRCPLPSPPPGVPGVLAVHGHRPHPGRHVLKRVQVEEQRVGSTSRPSRKGGGKQSPGRCLFRVTVNTEMVRVRWRVFVIKS